MNNKPLRVLQVFSTLDRGGAESMCMNLFRHVDRSKVQFDFIKHTEETGAFEDEILALGGKVYVAPRFKEYNRAAYRKWWLNHFNNHPEHNVVHGHFFTISDVYLGIAKSAGRITIGHSHCTPTPKSQAHILLGSLKRRHCSRIQNVSDYCFACSEPAGEWIFKDKPFKVLNNAIDVEAFRFNKEDRNQIRSEFDLGDKLVIGTVGRIMLQKNPLGMVDIFNEVHKRNSNSAMLWVGDDSECTMGDDAKQRAREYGILDSIIFTGVRSDIPKLLSAMDCFIFPSFFEGLGIVAIEAQASGMPCFISDTEAVPKEVALTELCSFLPLDKPALWADEILKTPLQRQDTTQQIIDKGYDIKTTAKWLENFYLDISLNGQPL